MSGHSKWSTIKRQKGAADAKRGQLFTKLANAITIAVREGGGITDPEANFRLRLAVDRAKSFNLPKENIERAVQRAHAKQGSEIEETLYEGFGPGGIGIIVEAVTDNRQRTTSEIKNIIEKNGGTMATPGSVSYQFEQKGLVTVKKDGKSFDDIFLLGVDVGAEDIEDIDGEALIYTKPEELKKIRDKLTASGLIITDAELIRKPISAIEIKDKDTIQKILSFIEKIGLHDDVQRVYSNFSEDNSLLYDDEKSS